MVWGADMTGHTKRAADADSSTGLTAPSPIPTPSVAPTFAPGKKGPAGLGPRTNYTRVNTGEPPTSDAGAALKSMPPRGAEMLPKFAGGEGSMGNIAGRATLQDLVKSAMVSSATRVQVNAEAARQAENLGEKVAAAPVPGTKVASAQQVEKLASALDFLADTFRHKEAGLEDGATPAAAPPPGATAAKAEGTLPPKKGQATQTVPMNPGTITAHDGAQQLETNIEKAPGGREHMVQRTQGGKTAGVADLIRSKLASKEIEKQETEGMAEAERGLQKAERAHAKEPENQKAAFAQIADQLLARTKEAEDAINPAQISAGPAVAPEFSAAGEPGGQPAGGAPQGPTGLVASNEAAQKYTKGEAYANRKQDLGKYLSEPALGAAQDNVLQVAFNHTSEAGPKIASAQGAVAASVKTAAARALLTSLAKSAEAENAKTASAQQADKMSMGFSA